MEIKEENKTNKRVILFSTGCPQCGALKQRLDKLGVEYTLNNDTQAMLERGFTSAPMLQVGEEVYDFAQAKQWIGNIIKEK